MESFKSPLKAVPGEPELKGLEEPDNPSLSPETRLPIDWGLTGLGVLIGVCVGLAYVLNAS